MQLEVEFDTLAELEHFWAAIPPQDHKAWSQRAQVNTIRPCLSWNIVANSLLIYKLLFETSHHITSLYCDVQ